MSVFRTNMISTKDKKLILATNNDLFTSQANINQWDDSAKDLYQWTGATEHFNIQTKDIDFKNPSRRKKVYRVYVTFKAGGYMSGVVAKYATNGSNSFDGVFNDTTYYSASKGFDSFNGSQANSSADWITVGLKPTTALKTNKIKSLQLKFEFAGAGRFSYNLAQAQSSTDSVASLDASASSDDDYYNGMPFYIFAGTGTNLTRRIYNYTASGKVCNIDNVLDGNLTDADTIGDYYHPGLDTTSYYDVGFIPKEFAINDISIVYRDKPIK
tara:strand:- start:1679 stop:2488 length:810 start_codon:yes stop_codon:yes gene_type:complete